LNFLNPVPTVRTNPVPKGRRTSDQSALDAPAYDPADGIVVENPEEKTKGTAIGGTRSKKKRRKRTKRRR
jgi:hypothetical protein